jgi:hypothetical protein
MMDMIIQRSSLALRLHTVDAVVACNSLCAQLWIAIIRRRHADVQSKQNNGLQRTWL